MLITKEPVVVEKQSFPKTSIKQEREVAAGLVKIFNKKFEESSFLSIEPKLLPNANPQNNSVPLVLQIKTKDIDIQNLRRGIDIVILLDTSSSMNGKKIQTAIQSIEFIFNKLQPFDRLSLISFASNSEI